MYPSGDFHVLSFVLFFFFLKRRHNNILTSFFHMDAYNDLPFHEDTLSVVNMASNIISPSLTDLPLELFYRILDHLDTNTILFHFGHVCRYFRSIIPTYNAYELNFKSSSKRYFHTVCERIHSRNISSLILSNDNHTPDQIKLFFMQFRLSEFIHLRSLTLIEIDENDFLNLFPFVKYLSSLTITFRNHNIRHLQTLTLLAKIITNSNLRYLDLTLANHKIQEFPWPNSCFLRTLILANHLEFRQYSTILTQAIHLNKFILHDCSLGEGISYMPMNTYPQLISLTFEDSVLTMDDCQVILALTPSLQSFHIVGGTNLVDGLRWEEFIRTKLLNLKIFQFAFCGTSDEINDDASNVGSLITSFQTPFWLQVKHWFVVCYYFKQSANFSLYSLPICKANVRFYPHRDKISCSTHPNLNEEASSRNNVHEMQLNLTNLMANYDNHQNDIVRYPFFRQLNKLILCVDHQWPEGSMEHLSLFIDLSVITELSISIDFRPGETFEYLADFLRRTSRLYSLMIDSSNIDFDQLCEIIPSNVKHLQVSVKNIEDMKMIIERLKQLNSLTFEYYNRSKIVSSEFPSWLEENRRQSTYRIDVMYMSIWFDQVKQ